MVEIQVLKEGNQRHVQTLNIAYDYNQHFAVVSIQVFLSYIFLPCTHELKRTIFFEYKKNICGPADF